MRWLIEFVGIVKNQNGAADRPKPHRNGKSVMIDGLGGIPFDLNNKDDAKELADIWQGCSQSSLHPTTDTNHPPVGEKDLSHALPILLGHLEKFLYQQHKRNLLEVLHKRATGADHD